MSDEFSQIDYNDAFKDDKKKKEALKHALDIRKFEIELYWKRATYFWTFIAATLIGYAAIQGSKEPNPDLSVHLCCLGVVFSFGWLCVNKGSKRWLENWENHVDILEDNVIGPLYKVVLSRPKPKGFKEWFPHVITGPSAYSVSKINQIISLFVTLLWIILLGKSLWPLSLSEPINWEYVAIVTLMLMTCISFFTFGRTHSRDYNHVAIKRKSIIISKKNND